MPARRSAFTLREMIVVMSVLGVTSIAGVTASHARGGDPQKAYCEQQLGKIGQLSAMYSTDHGGLLFSFSWKPWSGPIVKNYYPSIYADLSRSTNDSVTAVIKQAVDFMRRADNNATYAVPSTWWPGATYSHLMLRDYAGPSASAKLFVCPSDAVKRKWIATPADQLPQLGAFAPPGDGTLAYRYRFLASYADGYYQSGPDADTGNGGAFPTSAWGLYNTYSSGSWCGNRLLSEVSYPGQKVQMWDEGARHVADYPFFFLYPDAVQPLLMFDGSVREASPSMANPGFTPQAPNSSKTLATTFDNSGPSSGWLPLLRDGSRGQAKFPASYWEATRGGLKGVDFGASRGSNNANAASTSRAPGEH